MSKLLTDVSPDGLQPAVKKRLEVARTIGLLAASKTLEMFQSTSLGVETKHDLTYVTEADRSAERFLRDEIAKTFADDKIVGEEFGIHNDKISNPNGWTWYLDPIDGTQAFVHGVPLFGTLIGVEYLNEPQIGVIVLPALGEMVYASRGEGCFWQKQLVRDKNGCLSGGIKNKAKVSSTNDINKSLFCTTWMKSFQDSGQVEVFNRLCKETGIFRGWGDCYGYALVATGRADIMVDPMFNVWDAAPMLVILEEAGGKFTAFDGKATIHGRSGVATNGLLHEQVLRVINRI